MIVSGALGGSRYEYEFMLTDAWAGIVVQLGREEAVRMIWWHHPEFAGMPPEEVPEMDDEDFVDALRDAVYAWVATFPLATPVVQAAKEGEVRGITTNRNDPGLRKIDDKGMQERYLVLSEEEIAQGFIRPVRRTYVHVGAPDGSRKGCGAATTMAIAIATTYARDPYFYGATYCVGCKQHVPVGKDGECIWDGTDERVGT